jgi:hypothetical protein
MPGYRKTLFIRCQVCIKHALLENDGIRVELKNGRRIIQRKQRIDTCGRKPDKSLRLLESVDQGEMVTCNLSFY